MTPIDDHLIHWSRVGRRSKNYADARKPTAHRSIKEVLNLRHQHKGSQSITRIQQINHAYRRYFRQENKLTAKSKLRCKPKIGISSDQLVIAVSILSLPTLTLQPRIFLSRHNVYSNSVIFNSVFAALMPPDHLSSFFSHSIVCIALDRRISALKLDSLLHFSPRVRISDAEGNVFSKALCLIFWIYER